MDEKQLAKDRLRFEKNKISSRLALIAIIFDVFYFVCIYKSDVGNFYYSILIGASIIYNLLFMLMAFLCSEGVKSYKMNYNIMLIVIGALQIVRIFILPRLAHSTTVAIKGEEILVMGAGQHTRVVVYLIISAVMCFAAGIVGVIKTTTLNNYLKEINA